jgi:nitrite reductase/ring-hydroxylating ferredoxin subunit
MNPSINRRAALQTLGLGGATLLAGCHLPTPTGDTTPPTVSLAASSSSVTVAGMVTLTATATDNTSIIKVEFLDDTTSLGVKTSLPYTLDVPLTAQNNGTRNFKAIAYDTAGNAAPSEPVPVTINIGPTTTPDTTPPTVTLQSSASSVTATGGVTLTATAADNIGVSRVDFYEGATLLGSVATAPYTQVVGFTAANNGAHSYTAKAFDAAGNSATSAAVSVTVGIDNTPPTVSLAASNLNVTAAGTITLTATATDNTGVTRVEFYEGTTLLGTASAAPYTQSLTFTRADNGTHNYTAKAFDAAANFASSAPVTVIVNVPASNDTTPPTVSLAASNLNVTAAGAMILTATATDNVGVIKVEFYEGATLIGTATALPYTQTVNYSFANNGPHSYTAKAFDAAGNSAVSAPATVVTVNIADTTAPTVAIATSSTNVTAAGSITLTATATDNVGVAKVEFYEGSNMLGTKTASPFTQVVTFALSNNGSHAYTAKAYDAVGNATVSAAVTVTVNISAPDTTPPTVSLAASSTNVTAAGSVTLTATATDNVGVSKVEFYEGTTLLGTKTAAPYTQSIAYTSSNNGSHGYTAKAYDAAGNVTTSTAVSVTVNISATGTGTLVYANGVLAANFPSVGSSAYFTHPASKNGAVMYRSAALQPGGVSVVVGGVTYYLVAYTRVCTHNGSVVNKPTNTTNHTMVCVDHAANFNCESAGANTVGPNGSAAGSTPALPSLTISNQSGDIYRP